MSGWKTEDLKHGRLPPQLRSDKFHFIKVGHDKKPIESGWSPKTRDHNPHHNYSHISPGLRNHIKAGNAYGILTGINGFIAIDCDIPSVNGVPVIMDNPVLANAIKKNLPRTFEVQTGGGGLISGLERSSILISMLEVVLQQETSGFCTDIEPFILIPLLHFEVVRLS